MGVERRAPPNPLRVSSETADGRGSILIDTTAAQQTSVPRLLGAHPLDANQSTRGTPKEVRELPGPNSRRELSVLAGVALPIPGRPTYSGRGSRRGRRWRGRGLEEAKPFSSALPRQRRRAA